MWPARSEKPEGGVGTGAHAGWRSAGPRPAASSQIQRVTQQLDLSTLTTGVRKDWFILVPQDSSFQRLLVSSAQSVELSGVMNLQIMQASGGRMVALSESHVLTRLTQQPIGLRASKAWIGGGAVYIAVTGTNQSVVLLATIEFMTSEIP